MTTVAKQFIRYALSIGAFEFPPEGFILKGTRRSPYLFNSGAFCTGESINMLARAYVETILQGNFQPDIIFGAAYKGIPVATAIAQVMGGSIGYSFNRKETKDHGEGGYLVGAPLKGKKVLIVDDVMTTGLSSRKAEQAIRAHGGTVIGCVFAIDRQEMGEDGNRSAIHEFENDFGIPVRSIANLEDLIDELEDQVLEFWPVLPKIFSYRGQYGAQY